MLSPSTAPRWNTVISTLRRAPPAASAVRARNDGAKPRLTSARLPFFRNTRRETIMTSLPQLFGGLVSSR
jgi:hypothetical protein